MKTLAYPLESSVDGHSLDLSFDNVLKVLELQREAGIAPIEKINLTLGLLLQDTRKIKRYTPGDKVDLLKSIFDQYIFPKSKRPAKNDEKKLFDFEQDAPYIYAGFMQAYGIDLFEQQGRLPWQKFFALFKGLPDNTKIREIMDIRGRKIPRPTKYNGEEIRALRDAKRFYALEISAEEAEQQFQRGVDRLANALAGRAIKAGEADGGR